MKSLAKLTMRSITMTPKYYFQFPSTHSDTHSKVNIFTFSPDSLLKESSAASATDLTNTTLKDGM